MDGIIYSQIKAPRRLSALSAAITNVPVRRSYSLHEIEADEAAGGNPVETGVGLLSENTFPRFDLFAALERRAATFAIAPEAATCYSVSDSGQSYRGTQRFAIDGSRCVPWKTTQIANGEKRTNATAGEGDDNGGGAYCRNPGGRRNAPWCFTSLGESSIWRMCALESCKTVRRTPMSIAPSATAEGGVGTRCGDTLTAHCRATQPQLGLSLARFASDRFGSSPAWRCYAPQALSTDGREVYDVQTSSEDYVDSPSSSPGLDLARRLKECEESIGDAVVPPMFSFHPPIVHSITPATGPTRGGIRLTLTGLNFGPPPDAEVSSESGEHGGSAGGVEESVHPLTQLPAVWIGGRPCTNVRHNSDVSVTCTAPPGMGPKKTVVIRVGGQSSNEDQRVVFDYARPRILRITPTTAEPSGGSTIRIEAANLGGTTKSVVSASIGGRLCEATTWVEDGDGVDCVVPSGWGRNLPVVVTVGGYASLSGEEGEKRAPHEVMTEGRRTSSSAAAAAASPFLFSYLGPEVIAIMPSRGPAEGGQAILIRGRLFLKLDGKTPTIRVGGTPCTSMKWLSTEEMLCNVPPSPGGMGGPFLVTVDVAGVSSKESHHRETERERERALSSSSSSSRAARSTFVYNGAIDCETAPWSEWSPCDRPCFGRGAAFGHRWSGGGMKHRNRRIVAHAMLGGETCPHLSESAQCSLEQPCPVECTSGKWSAWRPFALRGEAQQRTRTVERAARYGGAPCGATRENLFVSSSTVSHSFLINPDHLLFAL